MSPLWLIPLGYVACSYAAYRIFIADWTRTFDYKESDVARCLFASSMGPCSLLAACIVYLARSVPERTHDRVLVKRKDRQS